MISHLFAIPHDRFRNVVAICAGVIAVTAGRAAESGENPSGTRSNSLVPASRFQILPFGEIRPSGWMKKQLEADIRHGLFAYYHRSWQVQNKGFVLRGHNPDKTNKQPLFWDGEAEGYWGLALISSAILTEEPVARERAEAFVTEILQSQDADGYIGLYDAKSRYRPDTVDKDVSKGLLFQALLSYAQAYRRGDVLEAVERAVRCDMRHFNRETKGLWAKDFMVMSYPQFLDRLAQATQNKEYAEYAAFIIGNYSSAPGGSKVFADCTLANLLNRDKPFVGHACNTPGNLSLPWIAYYATGNQQYRLAGQNAFEKFARQMSLSGSLPGDEDNQGRLPLPEIGIEFCSTTYLVENALIVGDKTGWSQIFDFAERALYNAGMGARLPDGTAHAYLKRDNEFNLDYPGIFHRYQYSPDHEPFCCSTRMMSLVPVFVSNMFKRSADGRGIAAVCFGPATVRTEVNGATVTIEEKTLYPFDGHIEFRVNTDKPVAFEFMVRVPSWAPTAEVGCEGATITRAGDYYVVAKEWGAGDLVQATFATPVKVIRSVNNEFALMSGPLVFGAKIDATAVSYGRFPSGRSTKDTSAGRLPIYGFSPGKNSRVWEASLDGLASGSAYGFKRATVQTADPDEPWRESPVRLDGMMNRMRGKFGVSLVPMGCTVLRRVTFSVGYVYPSARDKDDAMRDDTTSL